MRSIRHIANARTRIFRGFGILAVVRKLHSEVTDDMPTVQFSVYGDADALGRFNNLRPTCCINVDSITQSLRPGSFFDLARH